MSDQELKRLRDRLRELARAAEQYRPSPKVATDLCDEFHRYHRARRIRQRLVIGSIAACLTIVFAGGTVMLRRALSNPTPAADSHLPPAAPVTRAPERPIAAEAAPPVRSRAVPGRAIQRTGARGRVVQNNIEHEVMTGFIPVGLGVTFGTGERGSLVRVRLPRSALATFGLPVNENRAADVNADVLLGEDGMARAIRFVQ